MSGSNMLIIMVALALHASGFSTPIRSGQYTRSNDFLDDTPIRAKMPPPRAITAIFIIGFTDVKMTVYISFSDTSAVPGMLPLYIPSPTVTSEFGMAGAQVTEGCSSKASCAISLCRSMANISYDLVINYRTLGSLVGTTPPMDVGLFVGSSYVNSRIGNLGPAQHQDSAKRNSI